ncbi:F0F1 ATP synthase subunit [Nitrosospira lacus]|uniref:F0F1 ATP synthase subunit n=1 Tax=Nitrosospira lacus TaxID=1288494 RepID=A0A1W6SQ31_9PROT|nr:AtpZ/AtpI family protein [Nitrosospira lacus]ARO87905.1 F0F1 ATP synthase subunit [Nitrosospira lacus]
MNEKAEEGKAGKKPPLDEHEPELSRRVGARAARKLRAQRVQRSGAQVVWSGLGMIGLVGWSVAVPTLLGAALGIWLDKSYPARFSWTLTMLLIGMIIGCLNAWHWVAKEDSVTHEEQEEQE